MIPFNRPYLAGRELEYIGQALESRHLSGDGTFTKRCHEKLSHLTKASRTFLTHSCTAALEMAALLLDLEPGDEVIMPSYTFVSTANAFVLRGAVPVFVDIREDTLNLDERLVEDAITAKTRAICVVHYAGVACAMDPIMEIAERYGLAVVEDAAQAIYSTYRGRPIGAIGHLGAMSFHETKNIISGEGGALLVRDEAMAERAEILREKGTNRNKFFRGQVDKYTWVDVGSSYLPSELIAAFLAAQLEQGERINARRMRAWTTYYEWAGEHDAAGRVRRPVVPADCGHNAHLFYLVLPSLAHRSAFIAAMKELGVSTVFHYVPLHSAPAGMRLGRTHGDMAVTDMVGGCLVRMPLWVGIEDHQPRILEAADECLRRLNGAEG